MALAVCCLLRLFLCFTALFLYSLDFLVFLGHISFESNLAFLIDDEFGCPSFIVKAKSESFMELHIAIV